MIELAVNVIVDAFGGDNAPLEVIRGCERAVRELGVKITLTGREAEIKSCAEKNGISLDGIDIVHTDDVFDIHEEPKEIIKSGKNWSRASCRGQGRCFCIRRKHRCTGNGCDLHRQAYQRH